MIFILSEHNDHTTSKVVEWLQQDYKIEIIRVNEGDKISIQHIHIHHDKKRRYIVFKTECKSSVDMADVLFYWYRRGNLTPSFHTQLKSDDLTDFIRWEWFVVKNYILCEFNLKVSLGNFGKSNVNKLIILQKAADSGLAIPATYITEYFSNIKKYSSENSVISKPIGEALGIGEPGCYIKPFSVEVNPIIDCNWEIENAFPSLIQQKIDKWIEIRVFIMYEELYSMAIFSQNNDQTKTDFRDYDYDMMNRMVPYNLPDEIEMKILRFMEKAGLDTGSIDLILSKTGEYVFLEVNPAGNIEMVSDSCNYHIEKRIAERIIKEINNEPRPN